MNSDPWVDERGPWSRSLLCAFCGTKQIVAFGFTAMGMTEEGLTKLAAKCHWIRNPDVCEECQSKIEYEQETDGERRVGNKSLQKAADNKKIRLLLFMRYGSFR